MPDAASDPIATYRVQLHRGFDLVRAAALAEYLADLGISHLYASPYLQAVPGSTHGYDVIDHHRVSDDLGGAAAHTLFCHALARHGLRQLLDIVPNHMSIAGDGNRMWWDVLENGQASRYAAFFDVDWQSPEIKLRDTVLLPVLAVHYGKALDAGEIRLARSGPRFCVEYFSHRFPVAPRSIDSLLGAAAERAESDELAFIAEALGGLPLASDRERASVARRHRDMQILYNQLERLCREQPSVEQAIDEVVAEINASPDELDVLLERQNYRLAYWRTARDELDYRRFFDVNLLVGLRVEDERVFRETHELVLDLVRNGLVHGLRVDHPDGLLDPEAYFHRLREAAPEAWIVAEKILAPGEALPDTWPVAGTTGYDFIYRVDHLLLDPAGESPLTEFYAEFTGESTDYAEIVRQRKLLVQKRLFASDLNRLASLLGTICEQRRRFRDFTRRELSGVVRETIACLKVYRTYVRPDAPPSEADVQVIGEALACARTHRPDLEPDLFDLLEELLLLRLRGPQETELLMQFQQQTGPVTAKGVEDTSFYVFNRLLALNEVGGEPGHWSLSLEDFHAANLEARARRPHSLLASTTHDTKRSEDVRARLLLLSEIPGPWSQAVRTWSALNEPLRRDWLPDRNCEYLLYQTLVGAWPIDADRMVQYLHKATREAKEHTSWTEPNEKYEQAVEGFARDALAHREFVSQVEEFVARLIEPGRINSLTMLLLKLTCPGVPDIYQGAELGDYSLVDPDNRRPVDFETRRSLLSELNRLPLEQIKERAGEGLTKLWVLRQTLAARRLNPHWLGGGAEYAPLSARGPKAEHAISFLRGGGAISLAPRYPLRLGGQWEDTWLDLPEGRWLNHFTGQQVEGGARPVAELLAQFPVALLLRA